MLIRFSCALYYESVHVCATFMPLMRLSCFVTQVCAEAEPRCASTETQGSLVLLANTYHVIYVNQEETVQEDARTSAGLIQSHCHMMSAAFGGHSKQVVQYKQTLLVRHVSFLAEPACASRTRGAVTRSIAGPRLNSCPHRHSFHALVCRIPPTVTVTHSAQTIELLKYLRLSCSSQTK